MNFFFLHTYFFAAPDDVDKWMNILFVVVLAVFWALRGLFREKLKESKPKSSTKDQPTRKPIQRSSERARALWEQFLEQTRQPSESPPLKTDHSAVPHQPQTSTSSKSFVPKVSSVSKQPVMAKTPKQPLKPKQTVVPSLNISSSKPNIPEFVVDTQILPESSIMTEKSLSESDYISFSLFDYSYSDELRKAILHYEILGKPLSIRSQSDYF